jgi:hypothetical protein
VSEPISSVHLAVLLHLHQHANDVRQALTCQCIALALARHALRCAARPHPTTVPVPIRMSSPSRRARPTICLRRSIARPPTPRCPVLCRSASPLPPYAATHGRLSSPPRLFSPTRNGTTTITLTFKTPLMARLFNPPLQRHYWIQGLRRERGSSR